MSTLPVSAPPVERRASVRRLCQRDALSYSNRTTRAAAWLATVRNVSEGGIGLLLYCQFPPGTILAVQPLSDRTTRTLLARVVHTSAKSGGWYHGCELAASLNTEELGDWA